MSCTPHSLFSEGSGSSNTQAISSDCWFLDESTGNFFWDEKANSKTKVKGYVNYGKEFEYFNKKTGLYYYFNNDGPHFVTLPPLTLIYERSRLTIWLDRIQEGLDYGGIVEPTPFCDIINGTIYIIRGKWYEGLITLGGIVPYVGDLGKIAKYSKKYSKVAANTGGQGGLNLFKWGAEQTGKSSGWKAGDYMLHLPIKETPKLNWKANYGALRREMGLGNPIYDSYSLPNGNLIPTGGFLNAEKFTLQSHGWIYNPSQRALLPPIK